MKAAALSGHAGAQIAACGEHAIGARVGVWWEGDQKFFNGVITYYDPTSTELRTWFLLLTYFLNFAMYIPNSNNYNMFKIKSYQNSYYSSPAATATTILQLQAYDFV